MKFDPSGRDNPQLHRKYVSTLKSCGIIEMHPGDNGTKFPSLHPIQRDVSDFEVVLVNGIVDNLETRQFIITNRHFYLQMRFIAGWLSTSD